MILYQYHNQLLYYHSLHARTQQVRRWACEMRRAKLCNAIVLKQNTIRAYRTKRRVMNHLRVAIVTSRHEGRVQLKVLKCLVKAIRMREIAISRCNVIRKVWWWRLARESFERWNDLVTRRLKLKRTIRFVRGRTEKFHFEAWHEYTVLSRYVRASVSVARSAAKNACRFSAIASLQPQRAHEMFERITRQAELDRVIFRNGVRRVRARGH